MEHRDEHQHADAAYRNLGIEMGIDFVVMYLVMYTMVNAFDDFYLNLNNVYMTLMMVAPMAIIMLCTMRSMFTSRRRNIVVGAAAAAVFVASLVAMRTQGAVGDRQFLRSMIPHHSGAVLMCERASLNDPEVVELCRGIVASQKAEITQMQAILDRY